MAVPPFFNNFFCNPKRHRSTPFTVYALIQGVAATTLGHGRRT